MKPALTSGSEIFVFHDPDGVAMRVEDHSQWGNGKMGETNLSVFFVCFLILYYMLGIFGGLYYSKMAT